MIQYALVGWTGYVPESIHNMHVHLPVEYARFLWGWPNKLVKRLDRGNTRLVLVQRSGAWSVGFDSAEDLERVPESFSGVIWTDRIDLVGGF